MINSFKIIFLFYLLSSFAFADKIIIPDDFSTIQLGIDASENSDTILVQPGIYKENIKFNGKKIILASLFLTTGDTSFISSTIIDGNFSGSTVVFDSTENENSQLIGFKIINGNGTIRNYTGLRPFIYGGGIFMEFVNPTLKNLIVAENESTGGGGIFVKSGNPFIENVTIYNNHVDIPIFEAPNVGGGILLWDSDADIFNCRIFDNFAETAGGGIYCLNSSPVIDRSLICKNRTVNWGGAFFLEINSNPVIKNSTIYGNNSDNFGGGIFCWEDSNPVIINSILWNNRPHEIYFYDEFEPNSVTVAFSDVLGGEDEIVTNNNGVVNWMEGNINKDPNFENSAENNYQLKINSPCINSAASFFSFNGETLVDLSPNEYFGTSPDMGAIETNVERLNPDNPENYLLLQNYPNPFNGSTKITYLLNIPGFVEIRIYDMLGKQVETLLSKIQEENIYTINYNPINLSSGTYIYVLFINNNLVGSKKMLYLK